MKKGRKKEWRKGEGVTAIDQLQELLGRFPCLSWALRKTLASSDANEKQCVCVLSRARLFATPWIVARQAPSSMRFSMRECWSGLPFPPLEDFPNPGIKPRSPALQANALPSELLGKLVHTNFSILGCETLGNHFLSLSFFFHKIGIRAVSASYGWYKDSTRSSIKAFSRVPSALQSEKY